jgi:CBS domain-containing protein
MTTVNDLISRTPGKLWTVAPGDTVFRALQAMANGQVGTVFVVETGRLVGVVRERDYARKVELANRSAKTTTVAEIMSTDVVSIEPECSVEECLALMAAKRLPDLPVIEGTQILGVVNIADLVARALAKPDAERSAARGAAP